MSARPAARAYRGRMGGLAMSSARHGGGGPEQAAGAARNALDAALELAVEAVELGRGTASDRLDALSSDLERVAGSFEDGTGRAARSVVRAGARAARAAARAVRERSAEELVGAARERAARRPLAVAAIALSVGFLAVRVARASR